MIRLLNRTAELSGFSAGKKQQANIMFVGDRRIARINEEYVGHRGATDVITFSYLDDNTAFFEPEDVVLEIIISVDTAVREGRKREDSSYAEELALYITHGFLHASGEDDLDVDTAARMRRREKEVMDRLKNEFKLSDIFREQITD